MIDLRAQSDSMDLWTAKSGDDDGIVIELSLSEYGVSLMHFLPTSAALELAQTIMTEVWRMEGESGV